MQAVTRQDAAQAQDHEELAEFASLELSATAESEQALAGRVAELEAQLTEHMAAQDSTQAQLSSAQAALAQAEEKVAPCLRQRLFCAHSSSQTGDLSSSLMLPPMWCPHRSGN